MRSKIAPMTIKWEKSTGKSFGKYFLKIEQVGSVKLETFFAQGRYFKDGNIETTKSTNNKSM